MLLGGFVLPHKCPMMMFPFLLMAIQQTLWIHAHSLGVSRFRNDL